MQLYFSPEFYKQDAQVLNIVTDKNKPVGYLAFLMTDKKVYVYGSLEEEGVTENFKDLVTPYILGFTKMTSDLEIFTYLSIGGKKLELELDKE